MLRLLSCIAFIVFLSSCHNCVCIKSDGLRLGLISFDPTEVDTLVKRKFVKGSNFTQLIDTLQTDRNNSTLTPNGDTLMLHCYFGQFPLSSGYDYQLFIPALNRTIQITDIYEPQREASCPGKTMCVNFIESVKLNGSTNPTLVESNLLFLRK